MMFLWDDHSRNGFHGEIGCAEHFHVLQINAISVWAPSESQRQRVHDEGLGGWHL